MSTHEPQGTPILIKKYGNRRLYDTFRSRYITLDDLAGIVRDGATVKVVEASTDRDLTRQVLLQVLLEQQEALNMVPVELLHAVLRVQGTLEQAPFAAFLSATTRQFLQQGNQVAQQFRNLVSGFAPHATASAAAPGASQGSEAARGSAAPPPAEPDANEPPPAAGPVGEPERAPGPPAEGKGDLGQVRARMDRLLGKLNR